MTRVALVSSTRPSQPDSTPSSQVLSYSLGMDTGALEQDTNATPGDSEGLSRAAAARFAEKWKNASSEKQLSQAFWHSFFQDVIGISDIQEAGIEFEKPVISSKRGTTNFIDVFWKDTFLVEQKSAGKDMDSAEAQARDYVVSLPPALRPPVVIVCDFVRFRIVDILLNKSHEFSLSDLPDNLSRIEAVVKHRVEQATLVQVEADQEAARLMADLYIQLEKFGYAGHDASVFMVRILFCLFADDTRMWKTDLFYNLVMDSNPLGTDLGPRLSSLFQMLNTPKDQRLGPQDPLTADFPYVNGGIFSERIETINFNSSMRNALMNACLYDWSSINPTIFGALFQNIKSKDERHANGEHYTTEVNIEKTIMPLFIDELNEQLEAAWDSESKLRALQIELGTYQILDPACGCGNFLITTYKKLRRLELDIIVRRKQLEGSLGQTSLLDVSDQLSVKLEQLHGIEYVEWSAQIAKVAIYLTDHQENLKLESVLGLAANRFPLRHSASIVQGNALQIDWSKVCPIGDKTIIVGNPPFLGSNWQSEEQRSDQSNLWNSIKGSASLDYVANWYLLAARHIAGTRARCAFVSTNSITQGEQPAILWRALYDLGCAITFAHRTFAWTSEASGKAAVHCVIIGFSAAKKTGQKSLWVYATPTSEPELRKVGNINAYLADSADLLITSRSKPLSPETQPMRYGNMPNEFGFLANIYEEDLVELRRTADPALAFIRPIIGAAEMLQNKPRYCLWLVHASPTEMSSSPFIMQRIEMVRKLRSESKRKATVDLAATPYLFQEVREQQGDYLAVPIVSSESRRFVPMKIFTKEVVPTNALLTIPDVKMETFAILQSRAFSLWLETVGGRLESRYRISAEIVYNNFPFPLLTEDLRQQLSETAEGIIEARNSHPTSSLADLYKTNIMPQNLQSAHKANEKAVLEAFGLKASASEDELLKTIFTKHAAAVSKA